MRQKSSDNKTCGDLNMASGPAVCGRNGWMILVAVIVTTATAAAYWGVAQSNFVSFDDPYYVTDNYHVKQGLSGEGIKWAFTSFFASNWHPLTWLSHMLDVQLFGLRPAGHHITSLVFHVLNTLLLLCFLFCTTERLWPSAFVAAIFALHPLHVESVAWISERKDVLSTCFWMLTMLAYAWYAKKPSSWRYIVTLWLFALGLMAKPMLVTLPIVLLLLDYWPLARVGVPLRKLLLEKLPFVALSLASAAVTLAAQKHATALTRTLGTETLLTNAVVSYGRYIKMMLWPADLAVHYPHPHQPLVTGAIIVGAMLIAVTFVILRYRTRYPYIVTGWLWYLITLVPVIGIVQAGDASHADRYTYIPLTGLFVIVAWGAGSIVKLKPSLKAFLATAAVVVLVGAAFVTRQTVGYWKDNLALFSHATSVVPDSPKMEVSLAACLARMGRVDEAIPHLEKATRNKWHDGAAFNELGIIYFDRGDIEKAISYFTEAAKYNMADTEAEYRLGGIFLERKRYDEAATHLRRAIDLDPYSSRAYSLLAIVLSDTGRPDDAASTCDKALGFGPDDALCYYAKGYILAKAENFAGAAQAYSRSLVLAPSFPAYKNLAVVLERLGDSAGALANARRAIELYPDDAEAKALYERLTRSP